MGQFFFENGHLFILGQPMGNVDFRKIMDIKGILLANLSMGRLEVENNQLVGSFIVGYIQNATKSWKVKILSIR